MGFPYIPNLLVTTLVTRRFKDFGLLLSNMSRTARLSEEAHEKVTRIAEDRGVPVSDILDEIINGDLDVDQALEEIEAGSDDDVVGYCPECGEEFRESDVRSALRLSRAPNKYVRCPNRYQTHRGEEPYHETGRRKLNNEFAVDDLIEDPAEADNPINK